VLDKVNDDSVPVQITRRGNKGAIVMSIEDYDQLTETLYVLQNKSLSEQIEQSIKTHEARADHKASQQTINEITGNTWQEHENLRKSNRALQAKLCKLIKEMLHDNPAVGTGKPEPLKHQCQGLWSRRFSAGDRVIYRFDDDAVYLFAIGGHHDQFK